jgi:hypothetical protein
MIKRMPVFAVFVSLMVLGLLPVKAEWNPPSKLSRQEIVEGSQKVMAMPDIPITAEEEISRIRVLGMDWDIAVKVYEPEDPSNIPIGPDGKKVGVFIIHGGGGDHRGKDSLARLISGKFGFKVASMSYPGYLYLLNESHDWPGEPVNPDVQDTSMMDRYGTLQLACAKEGTDFYDRMAAFPVVFEEAGKDLMGRHLPEDEYSIYIHGHSTGGPFSFMLTQRVANIVGILGMENSPFGYIYSQLIGGRTWNLPFSCLSEFTWRITAMYAGSEALDSEGGEALMHLPQLMEQVLESYQRGTTGPRFKAEYPVHLNGVESLIAAARATAERLDLNAEETAEMVRRYRSYPRELSGRGVKPVPPVLFSIAQKSKDHTYEGYTQIVLPMFAAMNPAPKVRLVPFEAGVHSYSRSEPDLPMGLAPAMVQLWHDAIMGGYFQ